jgi:hypothetical protein
MRCAHQHHAVIAIAGLSPAQPGLQCSVSSSDAQKVVLLYRSILSSRTGFTSCATSLSSPPSAAFNDILAVTISVAPLGCRLDAPPPLDWGASGRPFSQALWVGSWSGTPVPLESAALLLPCSSRLPVHARKGSQPVEVHSQRLDGLLTFSSRSLRWLWWGGAGRTTGLGTALLGSGVVWGFLFCSGTAGVMGGAE